MSDDIHLVGDPPDLVAQNRWISGIEKAVQSVALRLGRFRGEWFLDPASGLRWMDYLGQRNFSRAQLLEEVRREVLLVERVEAVTRLDAERDGAGYQIHIDVVVFDDTAQQETVLGLSVDGTGRVTVL